MVSLLRMTAVVLLASTRRSFTWSRQTVQVVHAATTSPTYRLTSIYEGSRHNNNVYDTPIDRSDK